MPKNVICKGSCMSFVCADCVPTHVGLDLLRKLRQGGYGLQVPSGAHRLGDGDLYVALRMRVLLQSGCNPRHRLVHASVLTGCSTNSCAVTTRIVSPGLR